MAKNGSPLLTKLFGVRKDLLRGDSIFAILIFIVVGAFLVNLVASVWHNLHFQKDLKLEAGIRQVESTGGLLAKTTEALLLANELSMLRRVVSETALEYQFTACSVVLPNGDIVADADPDRINLLESFYDALFQVMIDLVTRSFNPFFVGENQTWMSPF